MVTSAMRHTHTGRKNYALRGCARFIYIIDNRFKEIFNKKADPMKKITLILLSLLLGVSMAAEKKILVVYYSRADENYSVGNISKGNTEIIAEMIAKKTGGTL